MKTKIHRGFTLLELTIALGILVIMAAAAIFTLRPGGSAAQQRALEQATTTMAAHMRQAQRLAMAEGRQHEINFDAMRPYFYSIGYVDARDRQYFFLPDGIDITTNLIRANAPLGTGFTPRGTPTHVGTITLRTANYFQDITIILAGAEIRVHPVQPRLI